MNPSAPRPAVPLWQRVLPHVLALAFLALLACVYFAPIVFDGKTLAQHDITQFKGGAHETQDWAAAHGHEPLWTNAMFSGMPTYLISVHFPGDWSVYLQKALTLGLPGVVSNLFVALLCGYVLMLALGRERLGAVAGAVAIGFSSYNLAILAAGHNTKSFALAYAPLVLAGLWVTFRRDKWLGAALFAVGLTLNVRANHPQITYYLGLLVVIFGVIELVAALRAGRLGAFGGRVALLGLGAALAVGVSFGRLYTTYSYSKLSNRTPSELTALPAAPGQAAARSAAQQDRDYAFAYSYGVGETLTLLVPNFYGGSSAMPLGPDSNMARELNSLGAGPEALAALPTYWGDQAYVAGPVYLGVVVCFLFVLGLFVVDRRTRYWLLLGVLLSFVLAWGKNFETFNNLVFDFLPGYRSFRAVSMALVMAQLAVPILAALALGKIMEAAGINTALPSVLPPALRPAGTAAFHQQPATRHLLYAGAVVAGTLALLWVASFSFSFASANDAGMMQQGFTPQLLAALRADRADLLRNDLWRGLLFVGAALAVLYFHLRGQLGRPATGGLVLLLILVDLWGVDKRYLNDQNFQSETLAESFVETAADRQILQDKDYYRVFNVQNPFNEANTSYFHHSIGGYHGAKLRRYQDLIERQIATNNPGVLNMLNTRYVVVPGQAGQQGQPATGPQAQRNSGALGNAWFVRELRAVPGPDAEMAALGTLDTRRVAVVDAGKFPQVKPAVYPDSTATIALTAYAPDALTYRYAATQPGTIVFSEIYYANGWNAYLDGKPVPHFRVNFVLRALQVPAGAHEIRFAFEPTEYATGNLVSLVSSVLLVLVLLAAAAYAARR